MADEVDLANDHSQTVLDSQILMARRNTVKLPVGVCLTCGEDDPEQIPPDASFCCCECRNDYEALQRQRSRGFA